MPDLGRRVYTQNVVLRGALTAPRWKSFLFECALEMGMSPVGKPACWRYPVDGKGGNGMTMTQPITESFLVIDTWPDFDGAYLHISSCKEFDVLCLVPVAQMFDLGMDIQVPQQVLSL